MSSIIRSEFLYEVAPFPSCHASTIEETRHGMIAGFFGGTAERDPDVCIYVCRHNGKFWGEPIAAADGVQADGSRYPTWNPVLFQPRSGPLMLFYKVGPNPRDWWGMLKTSDDGGASWSDAVRLPNGILGPIKNKCVQLDDGTILSPTSIELGDEQGWKVYFEISTDGGKTWNATPYLDNPLGVNAIQPSILIHSQTKLQAIGRTKSGRMFETWSDNAGRGWSPTQLMDLPNPNSGTDAVTLEDGRHVLLYNHSAVEKVRVPLNVGISDDGKAWKIAETLEKQPGDQYSYPAVMQASNGLIHITYTWKRQKIRHVVLDPLRL